jgi:hypothetical protein
VISHFDIVLNANGRSFATTDHQGNDYDVKTIVAQALGHVAGLDYCSPGVTQAQCTARMTEGQADPPPGSLMYKLLLPGVGASAASADDLAGIRSLYPVLTPSELSRRLEARGFLSHVENLCAESGCALPEDEPNPAYQLTQSERSDLLEHDSFIMQSGFADPVERLGSVLYDQMLRDTAYSSQPETASRTFLFAFRVETLREKSATDSNGCLDRASMMASTAALPTPLIASSPKRTAFTS